MNRGKFLSRVAVTVCLLCLALTVAAQTKKRPTRRTTGKTNQAAQQQVAANQAEIRESAEKVSNQIVNVSKFLYLLGGIAQNIQDTDAASGRTGKPSPTNTKNKQAVITTIQNLRAGLAALESDFQAKPALLPYYPQISGISDIAANAEDQANAGQFVNSGKTLLQVVEKLSNTLASMS